MNDLVAVIRVSVSFKPKRSGEVTHRRVARGIDRIHLPVNVVARRLDQMFHQQCTQSQVIPFIGDRNGAFTLLFIRGRITTDAHLNQLSVVVHQGDEGQAPSISAPDRPSGVKPLPWLDQVSGSVVLKVGMIAVRH